MKHLTQEQRYIICVELQMGTSKKEIALKLKVSPSTISREINRNKDERNKAYKPELAQRKYETRKKEKSKKIHFTTDVKVCIDNHLSEKLSPEQIVGICKKSHVKMVSHERIYTYLWEDKKHGGDLYKNLRTRGKRYRKRGNLKDSRGIITNKVSIDLRPKEVENKERFGDLEMDTIIGQNHKGAILTINDRATGVVRIKLLKSKNAEALKIEAIAILSLWKPYLHTITSDNGKEFANHQDITKELGIPYFFAHPYQSWERGANENLNGLIRQYIPKSSSFEELTDEIIYKIQEDLNNRPRKRFNFETPNQQLTKKLHL